MSKTNIYLLCEKNKFYTRHSLYQKAEYFMNLFQFIYDLPHGVLGFWEFGDFGMQSNF